MRLLIAISALLMLAVSCKKSREYEGTGLRENSCRTLNIDGQNVNICFEELVEDSRCPANVNCIWQGVAKGRFKFTVNNNSTIFNLSTLTFAPHYQNEVMVSGYKIKLINIFPYPGTGGGNPSADVEITQ